MKKLQELLEKSCSLKDKKKVAVVAAQEVSVLEAVSLANKKEICDAILIGDKCKIEQIAKEHSINISNMEIVDAKDFEDAAKKGVNFVLEGKADFLMKGLLDTSILLKAVLNKEAGLRTESLLSHVMVYEVPNYHKLLFLSDGGMNIAPSLEQKKWILKNTIDAAKILGSDKLKIAVLAAKEKVSDKMQATKDAKELAEMSKTGEFGANAVVEGPLALDLAISKKAASIKGFEGEVVGDADILIVPNIEMGNGIGKTLTYFAGAKSAGVIMGAKVPVVLVSRADDEDTKLYSLAFGAMVAQK